MQPPSWLGVAGGVQVTRPVAGDGTFVSAEIDLVLKSESDLPNLAPAVDTFADANTLSARSKMALNLVLEELVTNVFMHGAGPEGATVTVKAATVDARVEGEVRDDGRPFDPLSRETPEIDLALEDREIGGLGIHMVRTMASELRYARQGGENVMRFALELEEDRSE
jgi:serine/threonine-protein kinase RsbW